jgi:hypothetical protein
MAVTSLPSIKPQDECSNTISEEITADLLSALQISDLDSVENQFWNNLSSHDRGSLRLVSGAARDHCNLLSTSARISVPSIKTQLGLLLYVQLDRYLPQLHRLRSVTLVDQGLAKQWDVEDSEEQEYESEGEEDNQKEEEEEEHSASAEPQEARGTQDSGGESALPSLGTWQHIFRRWTWRGDAIQQLCAFSPRQVELDAAAAAALATAFPRLARLQLKGFMMQVGAKQLCMMLHGALWVRGFVEASASRRMV